MNLQAEREELSKRFGETYRKHPVRKWLAAPELAPVPDDALRDAFMPVAVQGNSVFHRLFEPRSGPGVLPDYADEDAPTILKALRSALSRRHRVVVKSPCSLFPWSFLYDDGRIDENDLSTLDIRRFWGFRRLIQEELDGAARGVRLPQAPRIVAAISPDVDPKGEHLEGPLGMLSRTQPDKVTWIASAEALKSSLADFDADCLYFYGHAAQNDPPTPTTSYLVLDGMKLTASAIEKTGGPKFNKRPVFAFLNGCETSPLNISDESSVAGLLCLRSGGRVACVTSFAEVPIAFGRRFAQLFWGFFLGGANAGEALLRARTATLEQYNNPVGLLYNLFGRVETRIG